MYIERKLDFFARNIIISLLIIGTISILIRLHYFPYNVPLIFDGFGYFSYAIDTSILGHFPTGYHFPNNGWPALLSIFFYTFHSNNFLDYMALQRILSISLSVMTIIPVYLLCTRFFNKSYALVGASLFAFEPRLIQNSVLGITEPFYILLATSSLFLLLSPKIRYVYASFAIASFCSLVRYEGMLLFFVLSIIFFVRFKIKKKTFVKYALATSVFVLLLLPMIYLRIQTIGSDGLTSHIIAGGEATISLSSSEENKQFGIFHFVLNGFVNLFKYLAWSMLPYFLFFVPIGAFLIFKNRNHNTLTVILSIIVLSVPAFYAYSREIQDTRYLYVLYPLYGILSIFTIKKLVERVNSQNTFLILIIGGLLLSSGIFLDIKKYDYEHQRESYKVAEYVLKTTKVINSYNPESGYLSISPLSEISKFPTLMSSIPTPPIQLNIDATSLPEFIKVGRTSGLTHLVIDDNKNRPDFLKDVFNHEEKYPYLTKIFDSKDHGYKYHVKIYQIDYSKLS